MVCCPRSSPGRPSGQLTEPQGPLARALNLQAWRRIGPDVSLIVAGGALAWERPIAPILEPRVACRRPTIIRLRDIDPATQTDLRERRAKLPLGCEAIYTGMHVALGLESTFPAALITALTGACSVSQNPFAACMSLSTSRPIVAFRRGPYYEPAVDASPEVG